MLIWGNCLFKFAITYFLIPQFLQLFQVNPRKVNFKLKGIIELSLET